MMIGRWIVGLAGVVVLAASTAAQGVVDANGMAVLKRMSGRLAQQPRLHVEFELIEPEAARGGSAAYAARMATVDFRRSGSLRVELVDADAALRFLRTPTGVRIGDPKRGLFARLEGGDTLAAVLQQLQGHGRPLSRFLKWLVDPPVSRMPEGGESLRYVGAEVVRGQRCYSLVISGADWRWQIWIADSREAWPRRMVLEDGPAARPTILDFVAWDAPGEFPAGHFDVGEGVEWIDVRPAPRCEPVAPSDVVTGARALMAPGAVLEAFIAGAREVEIDGKAYLTDGSVYCQPRSVFGQKRYIVMAPPIGAVVERLPVDALRCTSGGGEYIRAGDVYYKLSGDAGKPGFVVIPVPVGSTIGSLPSGASKITLEGRTAYRVGSRVVRPCVVDGRIEYRCVE